MSEEDIEAQARELVALSQDALTECGVELGFALEVARELVPKLWDEGGTREQALGVVGVLRGWGMEWGLAAFLLLACHTFELCKKGTGL